MKRLSVPVLPIILVAFMLQTVWGENRASTVAYASDATKAIQAYEAGDWEEAVRELGRTISSNRENVSVLMMYAEAQLNRRPSQGSYIQQAIGAYRDVLRLDKANEKAAKSLIEIYLVSRNPDEAVLIANRFLMNNQNRDVRHLRAQAHIQLHQFQVAYDELESIIQAEPNAVSAYGMLGQLIEQRPEEFEGNPRQWFDLAVRKNPDMPMAYILRAGFLIRHNDRSAAIQDLKTAAKLDLSDHKIRMSLAQSFLALGKKEHAREQLDAVEKDHPEELTLWHLRAQFADSNETMLAVAQGAMSHLGAKVWDFYPIAAELFARAEAFEKAQDIVGKMTEKDYRPDQVAFIEGLIANQKGQFSEAVALWQRSLQLGNKSVKLRLSLTSALEKTGDKQALQDQLRDLVLDYPNRVDFRLALARHFGDTGDWESANRQALEALAIAPNDRAARLFSIESQVRLLAARVPLAELSEWDRLERQIEALPRNIRNRPFTQLMLTEVLLNKGDLIKAEQCLDQIQTDDPENILKRLLMKSTLLVKQDRNEEAVLALKQAMEDFPQSKRLLDRLVSLLLGQEKRVECQQVLTNALERLEDPERRHDLGLQLGRLYQKWAEPEKALALISELDQNFPDTIEIKRFLLSLSSVVEDKEKAQSIIDQIKRIEGQDGWQWRYEQARFWARDISLDYRGKYTQAVSLLERNLTTNPDDQASRILLATVHYRAGEVQVAIETYQEALRRTPEDLNIVMASLVAMRNAAKFDEVDQLLDQLARRGVTLPEIWFLQFESHLRHGRLDDATIVLETIRESDPDNPPAGLLLAQLLLRQGKLYEADTLLGELRSKTQDRFQVDATRVELFIRQEKHAEAIALCNELVDRNDNSAAYMLRAKTFAALGDTAKAQDDFDSLTRMEPNNPGLWVTKSRFYLSTGNTSAAVDDIDRALALDPQNVVIQKQAIRTYIQSGDPDRVSLAEQVLNRALQSMPLDPDLLLDRVTILLINPSVEATRQSLAILEQVTDTNPEKHGAWVVWVQLLLQRNDTEEAIKAVIRGLVNHPNDRALLLLKARAESRLSRGLATRTYEGLLDLNPEDIEVQLLLANMYVIAREVQKAVHSLVSHR